MSDGPSNNGEQPIQLSMLEPALDDVSERRLVRVRPGTPRQLTLTVWGIESVIESLCSNMPDDFETHESAQALYFAYGSNIWIDQMNRRCPENKYVGTAELHDW